MSSLSSAPTSAPLEVLAAAAMALRGAKPRPDGKAVTAALLEAEKTAKQQRQTYTPNELYGTWRLCFTAPKKPHYRSGQPVGNGFYVPTLAVAQISFLPDADQPGKITIRNQLRLGPLQITFSGPARSPGKKNLLAFDFTRLEIKALGATLYSGATGSKTAKAASFDAVPVAQLPFFSFFLAQADYLAARGRSGGLALWVRAEATAQE
ncbi:hypothetical protein [Pseudanabaena sp. FACHB-2040]|uniref:hypothetical protein n=1 Tax=Pseudanabaena sp. FACHB-2040 TaxID=2692859 RepID=UPI0016885726|nr:hypothetical protein [Pseudanabaena sp. FACHB-2040]MBD2260698.1 hypothetical protein [Pseudanabaena sp. FACHB-2040]